MEKKQQNIQHHRNESKSTNYTNNSRDKGYSTQSNQPLQSKQFDVTPLDLVIHGADFYRNRHSKHIFKLQYCKLSYEDYKKYGIDNKYTYVCKVFLENSRIRRKIDPIVLVPFEYEKYQKTNKKALRRTVTATGPTLEEVLDIIRKDEKAQQKIAEILTYGYEDSKGNYGCNLIKNISKEQLYNNIQQPAVVCPEKQKSKEISEGQQKHMRRNESDMPFFANNNCYYSNFEDNIDNNYENRIYRKNKKNKNINNSNVIINQTQPTIVDDKTESDNSNVSKKTLNQNYKTKTNGCCCNCIFTCCPGGKCSCCEKARVGYLETNIASNNKAFADNNVLANNNIANKSLGAKKKRKEINCDIF